MTNEHEGGTNTPALATVIRTNASATTYPMGVDCGLYIELRSVKTLDITTQPNRISPDCFHSVSPWQEFWDETERDATTIGEMGRDYDYF